MTPSQQKIRDLFFLRHGETDHNRNRIFDDITDIALNKNGRKQALLAAKNLSTQSFRTVYVSPLQRAQETYELISSVTSLPPCITTEKLKECSSSVWRQIVEHNDGKLPHNVQLFVTQISDFMENLSTSKSPVLIIAHGGVFWALCHLFDIPLDKRLVGNCELKHLSLRNNCYELL